MCGIAGIIGRVDDGNRAALARMTNALVHRGPDSAGFWSSDPDDTGYGCLLGHRRLAILDLSEAAEQPMSDPHSGATLVYNGETYNFKQLRSELQGLGEQFRSTGDTAVLLRLLALQGPDAVA